MVRNVGQSKRVEHRIMIHRIIIILGTICGVAWLPGCSTLQTTGTVIGPGDLLKVNYTCSIKDKGVVDTTFAAVADDADVAKSRVFIRFGKYEPLGVTAGTGAPASRSLAGLTPLDTEILNQIAQQAVGKQTRRTYDMVLTSQTPSGISPKLQYRVLEKRKKLKKVFNIPLKQFVFEQKREPEIGEVLYDNGVPSVKVVAANDEQVTYEMILAEDGPTYRDTEFGVCQMDDLGNGYIQMTLNSEVGRLVRLGQVVGRVSRITDDSVVIDYGNPFADYSLECKVQILDQSQGADK